METPRSAGSPDPAVTEIAVILDRSGSMNSIARDAIGGFNAFVTAQRQAEGSARLSLVLFDDQYEVPIKSVPLADVPELTSATFVPRGSTALFDAIGRTLKKMTASFASRPGHRKPRHIIVAILTDGEENASREYTGPHVADLIAEKRLQGWEFVFLAANQDAFAAAERLNIAREDAASFCADAAGTAGVFQEMSERVLAKRALAPRPAGKKKPAPAAR